MNDPTQLISVRLPRDVLQKCDSEAALRSAGGKKVSRTDVIVDALREALLGGARPQVDASLLDEPPQLPYRCPALGCTKRFGSKKAVCPVHGKKVVEAAS